MEIELRLFAGLRETAGFGEKQIELPAAATVGDLLVQLAEEYPALELADRSIYVAVNQQYAAPDVVLQEGDTVALFPPVSGGCGSGLITLE